MKEELVRLILDRWQEHTTSRRRELERGRLQAIQQDNEMARAARRTRRPGIQSSGNPRAGDEEGLGQNVLQRAIPEDQQPDPIAAPRQRRNNTQRRRAATRRRLKTTTKQRDELGAEALDYGKLTGRVELDVEESPESEVEEGGRTPNAQERCSIPTREGPGTWARQEENEETAALAQAILINICAGKLGPWRGAGTRHEERRARLGG